MFVLWRIISLSELLDILKVKPKEDRRYVHSVVYLAQDSGAIDRWYPDFCYTTHVFSLELEKDLQVLRTITPDFGKRRLNEREIVWLRDFTDDRTMAPLLAERVFSLRYGSITTAPRLKKDVIKRLNESTEKYLSTKPVTAPPVGVAAQ
ncbi:MAG: hypothetical protein QW540_09030 [Archaeoglobaceae archaeon]